MPVAQFQLPDGRIAEFEVPAGMSDQDIQRAVYPQLQQLIKPTAPVKEPESGVLRQIADVPLGVAKGAVSGTRMLTDIFGATPSNVAKKLVTGSNAKLVAGVNLPMLLRTVCYCHESLDALVDRALSGGSQGVMQVAMTEPQNPLKKNHDTSPNDHQQ